MNKKPDTGTGNEIHRMLEEALAEVVKEMPAEEGQLQARRNFRFGLALICLAPFCLIVGFLPWPGRHSIDILMWGGASLVLLVVGAWKIDRGQKMDVPNKAGTNELPNSMASQGKTAQLLRRVK